MTAPADIGRAVLESLERAGAVSGKALRERVHETLATLGVNVTGLLSSVRAGIQRDADKAKIRADRLKALADRVPDLERRVRGVPLAEIRKHLVNKQPVEWIAARCGVPRQLVRDVRDLDRARAAKRELVEIDNQQPARRDPHGERGEAVPPGERFRHEADTEAVTKLAATRQYRFLAPLEQVAGFLTIDQLEAARLLVAAHDAARGKPKGGDYGGSGGGSDPSTRPGLTKEQEQAARVVEYFEGKLHFQSLRAVVRNFLYEEATWGPRPISFVEYGRSFAFAQDERRARWIGQGALLVVCSVLAEVRLEYDRERAAAQGYRRARHREAIESARRG